MWKYPSVIEYLKIVLVQICKWLKDRTQTTFPVLPTQVWCAWKLTAIVFKSVYTIYTDRSLCAIFSFFFVIFDYRLYCFCEQNYEYSYGFLVMS